MAGRQQTDPPQPCRSKDDTAHQPLRNRIICVPLDIPERINDGWLNSKNLPAMGGCFWQKRKPATTLHDCADIEAVASILTGIGLEALAKTIQIAAKQDRDLNSLVVCDRLNSLAVESFTANKAAFCSPLDRAALAQELAAKAGFLQAHSSWRSADDTHKALCPSTDDENQASRPVCQIPLPLIPPPSKDEDGTRRLEGAGNSSAEQLGRAAAVLSDSHLIVTLYTHTHTHTQTLIHTYIHTSHTYVYIHTYIHTYSYVHTYVRTYVCTHTHTHTHTHKHTHSLTHTYIHTYIHTYRCALCALPITTQI
jgi:hypothetical protein